MLSSWHDGMNFLLVTLDSCRWDTFAAASTPNLDAIHPARRGHAHATFTLPAHVAMFAGKFPHVSAKLRYYNRFVASLFRIPPGGHPTKFFIEFPAGTPGIFEGFEALGYETTALGAVGWFRHRALQQPFQHFLFTGINLRGQLRELRARMLTTQKPMAILLNVGETHEPYEYDAPTSDRSERASRVRMYEHNDAGFSRADFDRQVACCEFIDASLGPFLEELCRAIGKTLIVVCADHGECFGEDRLYGHGFYHHKVMEVPILIGEV